MWRNQRSCILVKPAYLDGLLVCFARRTLVSYRRGEVELKRVKPEAVRPSISLYFDRVTSLKFSNIFRGRSSVLRRLELLFQSRPAQESRAEYLVCVGRRRPQ